MLQLSIKTYRVPFHDTLQSHRKTVQKPFQLAFDRKVNENFIDIAEEKIRAKFINVQECVMLLPECHPFWISSISGETCSVNPENFPLNFAFGSFFIEYIIHWCEMMRKMGQHRNPCDRIDQWVKNAHWTWTLNFVQQVNTNGTHYYYRGWVWSGWNEILFIHSLQRNLRAWQNEEKCSRFNGHQ